MQPVLSDKVILRKHGNFGSLMPAIANLMPQFLEISDKSGQIIYHIGLSAIKKVKVKIGGIVFVYFDSNKIGLSFNSTGSKFFWSNFVIVPNDKSKTWANTINQYNNQTVQA